MVRIMHFKFSKMQGLGNDFMVVDCVTQDISFPPGPGVIQRLSDRHLGVGFDQMLVVEAPYDPETDFHYRIFNSDGSEVEQCGNGARCFAHFVCTKGLTSKHSIRVSTKMGRINLEIKEKNLVRVNMGAPEFEPSKIPFLANQVENRYVLETRYGKISLGAVSMGNPHAVIFVEDVHTVDIDNLGPFLESHEFFPNQVNVGFAQVLSRKKVRLRVYERGAGETKACGSGACGAVAVGIRQGLLDKIVEVHLPGGPLKIFWEGEGKPIYMTGPAVHVYDGQLFL